ncbi:hypothetical protein [Amnibacterium sp.]|uniref:hypothetical protein n=1 Tax=Amnibacterium sp. TaxID=1872496 RepID=UPI003F7BAB7B
MSTLAAARTSSLARLLRADLPGLAGTPTLVRFLIAAVVSIALSLAACAAVAAATIAIDPALASYGHLQAPDWTKLTVIGIGLASLGWPVAGAIWSRARVPFLLLTVIVTVVSFAPDFWILRGGQPAGGVLSLIVMHVAVAVVTYPALVLIAPQRRRRA